MKNIHRQVISIERSDSDLKLWKMAVIHFHICGFHGNSEPPHFGYTAENPDDGMRFVIGRNIPATASYWTGILYEIFWRKSIHYTDDAVYQFVWACPGSD